MEHSLILFSDLDGCLLNHHDYSYQPAIPVLDRLRKAEIPVILCSSKTEAEMRPLARELDVSPTITCENGGVICWDEAGERTVLGASREEILDVLAACKRRYQFESFRDLGIEGIMQATGLPREKAERSADRHCTEPLLWRDDEAKIEAFRAELEAHDLRLTRGGRFWHVSGQTDKGIAAMAVKERFEKSLIRSLCAAAIGDSGIDQPMLEAADIAIVIPAPDGEVRLQFEHPLKIVANHPGSQGWAQAVSEVLDAAEQ